MHASKRPLALGAAAALAVGLAACGSDDNGDSSAPSSAAAPPAKTTAAGGGGGGKATTVKVNLTEFKLTPADPPIAKPGAVTFAASNGGQVVHALEVEGPGGEKKTGDIQPGGKATLKVDFSKPGKYEWYCPIDGHKQQGMKGEIVVKG